MQSFDLDLHLPDAGVDVHVEFAAEFDHYSRKWEEPLHLTVEFADDERGDIGTFAIHDLDQSSRLTVEARIAQLLEERMPTEAESAEWHVAERGCRIYHDFADAAL